MKNYLPIYNIKVHVPGKQSGKEPDEELDVTVVTPSAGVTEKLDIQNQQHLGQLLTEMHGEDCRRQQ
jgi:hypothetical protein